MATTTMAATIPVFSRREHQTTVRWRASSEFHRTAICTSPTNSPSPISTTGSSQASVGRWMLTSLAPACRRRLGNTAP